MKKLIGMLAMLFVMGLIMQVGAMELNNMTSFSNIKAQRQISEFSGRYFNSMEDSREELERYIWAFNDNGIKIIKSEVIETAGIFRSKISYEGKEVLFQIGGYAFTTVGAKIKMKRKIKKLQNSGAIIVYSKAYKAYDEWGSSGVYSITYLLK